ncbi:MAG: DUF1559 domain-containing protein [Opitutaceae bacterium]|jgi:prepilin-type N-terminal cleavage/methylation domain-containing protein/prepilin-type processing-associated H-X9-DG protein|nr:DUF1559 domain-containing protein [Opitutaceae bacterium]
MNVSTSILQRRTTCHAAPAFTLVELLTVIAIIGILAAIIIPVVGKVRQSAKAATCLSNLRQMGVAIAAYRVDNKGFPPAPIEKFRSDSHENRTVWEGTPPGGYGAIGLGLLQYDGYLGSNLAGKGVADARRSPIFRCPGRAAGESKLDKKADGTWVTTNWIDYVYLLQDDRYRTDLDNGMAVAADVHGGNQQNAGEGGTKRGFHGGDFANVLRVDGSVHRVTYSIYSNPNRQASSFDRREPPQ